MIHLFQLSITLLLFYVPSPIVGDCTVEVKRATWNYHYGSDIEVPGVQTVEECKELCLNDPVNCRGYTHTTNGVAGFCYKFKQLTGMHACDTCSSGTTPEYMEGACPFEVEDELGEESAESAENCWKKCFDTPGCNSFTWYNSSTPFRNICFLFSACDQLYPCIGCQSGRVNCIATPQCFEYSILDEETRNNGLESSDDDIYYGDYNYGGIHQSPMWKGPGYYRMMLPAGLVIPEQEPPHDYCGTDFPGSLLEDSHPDTIGLETESVVWFNGGDSSYYRDITITKCPGEYYVYFLPETFYGANYFRYCASLNF